MKGTLALGGHEEEGINIPGWKGITNFVVVRQPLYKPYNTVVA